MRELGAWHSLETNEGQLVAAKSRPADLSNISAALGDANPVYRAKVLETDWELTPERIAVVEANLTHPELRVRVTALMKIVRSSLPPEVTIPILERQLSDPDPDYRGLATIELLRRGKLPAIEHLREFLEFGHDPLPFGATGTLTAYSGVGVLYSGAAPLADASVIALLLDQPIRSRSIELNASFYPQLAAAIHRDPKNLILLLQAYHQHQRSFAEKVLRAAGKAILPAILEHLKSDDRIVRSNAARACGFYQDAAATRPLLDALSMESGLARASIVWALGEIRAKEALPRLIELYRGSSNVPSQGIPHSQTGAMNRADLQRLPAFQYMDLSKAAVLHEDPAQEELLTDRRLFESIAKIGPGDCQDFYRTLATDSSSEARQEAAVQLIHCGAEPDVRNVNLLKKLAQDSNTHVEICAAVSLIILKQEEGRNLAEAWLKAGANALRTSFLIEDLFRVTDARELEFARLGLARIYEDEQAAPGTRNRIEKLRIRMDQANGR